MEESRGRHSYFYTKLGGVMNNLFGPESRRDLIEQGLQSPHFWPPGRSVDGGHRYHFTTERHWHRACRRDRTYPRRREDQREREPHGPLPRRVCLLLQ